MFWIESFAELRRPGDVGEQDRDDLAFLGRVVRPERQPTCRAEPGIGWEFGAAAGTSERRHDGLVS
jgi:hypothetical protein